MTLAPLYVLLGSYFALISWRAARDRLRPAAAARSAFFGILAVLFLIGDLLPPALAGALVLALAVIAGWGLPQQTAAPPSTRTDPGSARLLLPVLAIPAPSC